MKTHGILNMNEHISPCKVVEPANNHIKIEENSTITADLLQYRCCNLRPRFLQFLNRIKWVVFFFSLAHCLQNATNGLLGVTISTLEKRFGFSSLESSILASAYEMGQVPTVIFIMFFGQKLHRPIAIGCGMLLVTLGCFLQFLPQLFTPPYLPMPHLDSDTTDHNHTDLCTTHEHNFSYTCHLSNNVDHQFKGFLVFFLIGRFLIGVGSTPIVTVGLTFINDCTTKEQFGFFSGIFNSMSIVGPALGVLSASILLGQFVDFYRVDSDVASLGITHEDSRWIGNWWMGYFILMFFCFSCAIPTLGYANDLPGAQGIRNGRVSEAHTTSKSHKNLNPHQHQPTDSNNDNKDVDDEKSFRVIWDLLRNRAFVLTCLFNFCDMFIVVGFNAFGPKIFENFYHMQPNLAGLLFGAVLLPSGAIGTILGGFLISQLKMTSRTMMRVQLVLSAVVLCAMPILLVHCSNIPFAGVTLPLESGEDAMRLTGHCNVDCHCAGIEFQPVCSEVGVQYFSPCHAGCSEKTLNQLNNIYEYHNCACINKNGQAPTASSTIPNNNNDDVIPNNNNNDDVIPNNIDDDVIPNDNHIDAYGKSCDLFMCTKSFVFMAMFALTVCIVFVCFTMNTAIMFRVVHENQSNAAMSILILSSKLLGTIPGPLFFGLALDASCALKEPPKCPYDPNNPIDDLTDPSKCMLMHVDMAANKILIICLVPKIINTIGMVIMNCIYKPPRSNEKNVGVVVGVCEMPLERDERVGMLVEDGAVDGGAVGDDTVDGGAVGDGVVGGGVIGGGVVGDGVVGGGAVGSGVVGGGVVGGGVVGGGAVGGDVVGGGGLE